MTTTTTRTTPYQLQEYLNFESDGKPILTLPEKPVKREQRDNEKAVVYKDYVDNVFKPAVEKWKAFTDILTTQFNSASVSYEASLATTTTTSTTTTSATTTTTTTTTPYQIQEYLTFQLDGKPILSLPDKPVKREQRENEKAIFYKEYVDNIFKPAVEKWKSFTSILTVQFESANEKYQATLTTTSTSSGKLYM